MNNGVAACGFTFDPSDYYRQAISNMDGRPRLTFTSCRSAAPFPPKHSCQFPEDIAKMSQDCKSRKLISQSRISAIVLS